MGNRIGKEVFLNTAYKANKDQIYFKKGKAAFASRSNAKLHNKASVSHQMFEIHRLLKSGNSDRKPLAKIAKEIYRKEHKNYGCIRKIAFCINNLFRGRGFHDEKYFYNKIDHNFSSGSLSTTKAPLESKPAQIQKKKPGNPATSLPAYFDKLEEIFMDVLAVEEGACKVLAQTKYSVQRELKSLPPQRTKEMLNIWNEIIAAFETEEFRGKYGDTDVFHHLSLKAGDQVPQYFANVADGRTNWERKYLSLCGIRNVLLHGPKIIDDLIAQKFIDGMENYKSGTGLQALHYYTGTTVDLYTEIDAKNDKKALADADKLIVSFGKLCGFKHTASMKQVVKALPSRKLAFEESYGSVIVHDAGTDYKDRGNWGVWKRMMPSGSKYMYFANVPDLQSAIPAILNLPYMIAEMASFDKEKHNGKLSGKFLGKLFKNISDGCFNRKLNDIYAFYTEWKSAGGMDDEELALKAADDFKKGIEKGRFGSAIQAKGYITVLNEVKTRKELIDLICTEDGDYLDDNEPEGKGDVKAKAWAKTHLGHFKQFYKDHGLYKQILCQITNNSPYTLFDKKVLLEYLENLYNLLAF